jgi:hypothetical protein
VFNSIDKPLDYIYMDRNLNLDTSFIYLNVMFGLMKSK